ncbi:MAG: TonB family protein [Cytophagales bacterium]|nr:TonB family protein [Cytophagales bacterium]
MSNYLLELGAIHLALILGYGVLLRKERQYQKMRIYLIGSSLLALIIPLLKLPKISFGEDQAVVGAIELQPMAVNVLPVATPAQTSIWTPELFLYIYLTISGFLLLKFLANIFQIIRLERKSNHERFHNFHVRKVAQVQGSFTFFNWIFLNEKINMEHEDYHVILKHEKAHVSLGHSYDLLFLELFKVCFWWVPTIWFLNKEIRKIHEYQADAYALKTYHIDQYSSILISSTLATHGLSLASSFHDGFIFKRLNAMKQKAKTVRPWKLGALTALGAILLIAFACSEEIDNNLKEMGENSSSITFDQLPADMKAELASLKDELAFVSVAIPEDNNFEKIEALKEMDPDAIHTLNIDRESQRIFIALKKDSRHFNYISEKSQAESNLFTLVEEEPEYEEGMPAFYKQVASNIKYPKEARKNNIEGIVNVQFIVEKDGTLSEVKAIDGIGYGCDEEAVRVVKSVNKFNPGKQRGKSVRVRMVMPIQFKIMNEFVSKDGNPGGSIILEEVTTDYEKFQLDAKFDNGQWTGKIMSSDQKALPGVNVVVIGTTRGTVSDLEGNFTISASKNEELQVSFIGYESILLQPE